jgi:RimJ/RimL family protein N-acetyltransferase
LKIYSCLRRRTLSHRNYVIRTVQISDIELIRQWRNSQMDVLRQKKEISLTEQLAYYEKNIWPTLDETRPKNILLGYQIDDQLIGYGGLVHIDWDSQRAEVSFLLDPARTLDLHCYAADFLVFLQLIKTLAFDDLKLQRLCTETFSTREHHISVLVAADFVLEGVLRRHVILDGRPVDSLIHGCLNNSYAK